MLETHNMPVLRFVARYGLHMYYVEEGSAVKQIERLDDVGLFQREPAACQAVIVWTSFLSSSA